MLKEISKKLTMKKTLFTTQLEAFFNSITQEYQDLIHQLELEKRVLEEKIEKLEKDVKNLVEIKNRYEKDLNIDKKLIDEYKQKILDSTNIDNSPYIEKLKRENTLLKEELKKLKNSKAPPKELRELRDRVKKLQAHLAKGISAYNDNIQSQKSEELIKEITKELKK